MEECHKEGGPNNRPHNWKRLTTHPQHEGLAEPELRRKPGSENRTNEPEGNRDQKTSGRAAPEPLADGAADRGDEEKHEKT